MNQDVRMEVHNQNFKIIFNDWYGIKFAQNYINDKTTGQYQEIRRNEVIKPENDTAKHENRIINIKVVGDVHIVKIDLEDYHSEITISVYNLLGKKIMEIYKGKPKNIEDYPYEIPSWKLPNGDYICALYGKDFRKTEKFIVAR